MRILTAALLVAFICIEQAHAAEPVRGRAGIAGPGLITMDGETFRLWGILMPSRETRDGALAYDQFARLLDGQLLNCVPTDDAALTVLDAICRTGQGVDVAELLVREGWALDDGQRSRGYYLDEMEEAAARRRGVWGLSEAGPVSLEAGAERPSLQGDTIPDAPPSPPSTPPREPEAAPVAPPPPPILWMQVAGGRSAAEMSAELARMRATYPWLLEGRETQVLTPGADSAGHHRILAALHPEEVRDICTRLAQNRESCLLIERP